MIEHNIEVYDRNDKYEFDNSLMAHYYPYRVIELLDKKYTNCLSLGIGNGYTTEILSSFFDRIVVLEGDRNIINRYKKEFTDIKADIIETYFEEWSTEEKFDVIVLGCVLEHVDDPDMILKKYKHFLAPEGKLFIVVPNAESLNRRVGVCSGLLSNVCQLSEHDVKLGHKRYYTLKTLRETIINADLKIIKEEGIFLKTITTEQILKLDFSKEIIDGYMKVGRDYPELCLALLLEVVNKI